MTLRSQPVVLRARVPDGRTIEVRVVVPDDPYVPRSEIDTVVVELEAGDDVLGVVTTPLSSDDVEQAQLLGERIRDGLESGSLEPTAEGIETVASTRPA
jgi:hypothetical protein